MNALSKLRRLPWGVLTLSVAMSMGAYAPAHAQWVWKDKTGKVYSQLPPPPSVPEQDILQRPKGSTRAAPQFAAAPASAASQVASEPAKTVDPSLEAKRKKADEEADAKRRAETEKLNKARAENCLRAKSHLRSLEDGMRMARVNEKGEREILDDKARAQETQRAKDVIASDCK